MPLRFALAVAYGFAGAARRFTPGWRQVAERNLALAMPRLSPPERKRIITGSYRQLARVLVTVARMPDWRGDNVGRWVEYEGFEHYQKAIDQGRGVIYMTAHLGNWELGAVGHGLLTQPMYVMVRPFDNPLLDRLMEDFRTRSGNRTIRKTDSGKALLGALKSNAAVGILIDQNAAGADGRFVDFFGLKAAATSGFVRVAMRTGAAVVPSFCLWDPERRKHVIRFYPAIEFTSSLEADKDILENTQRCQAFLEGVIRAYPDQWLWIHRRWKTRPPGEAPLY